MVQCLYDHGFKNITPENIVKRFGKFGITMWNYANGIDSDYVELYDTNNNIKGTINNTDTILTLLGILFIWPLISNICFSLK